MLFDANSVSYVVLVMQFSTEYNRPLVQVLRYVPAADSLIQVMLIIIVCK